MKMKTLQVRVMITKSDMPSANLVLGKLTKQLKGE